MAEGDFIANKKQIATISCALKIKVLQSVYGVDLLYCNRSGYRSRVITDDGARRDAMAVEPHFLLFVVAAICSNNLFSPGCTCEYRLLRLNTCMRPFMSADASNDGSA